jgi:hypothetical protein
MVFRKMDFNEYFANTSLQFCIALNHHFSEKAVCISCFFRRKEWIEHVLDIVVDFIGTDEFGPGELFRFFRHLVIRLCV